MTCYDNPCWYLWMNIKQDGLCKGTLTSGWTSTIHILFLACTERMASILVPYWFSLYSPCSMNLGSRNKLFNKKSYILTLNNKAIIETYLLFKASASNCCLVTKWYSTPSFSWGFLGLVVSVGTNKWSVMVCVVVLVHWEGLSKNVESLTWYGYCITMWIFSNDPLFEFIDSCSKRPFTSQSCVWRKKERNVTASCNDNLCH